MPRITSPTFKQKKAVHSYLKHGNKRKAIQKAYGIKKKEVASVVAAKTFKHPVVQTYMRQVMEDAGLSDKKIATKIRKIIDAGTTDGALKTANPTQALKALEFAAKLKDVVPADKKQIESKSATLNIDLKGKTSKELEGILAEIIDETRQFKKLIRTSNEEAEEISAKNIL